MRKIRLLLFIFIILNFCFCGGNQKNKVNPAIEKYNRATTYLNYGRFEQAERILMEVIKIDDQFYRAYHNLGIIKVYQNNFDKAEEYFKKAIELNADNAEAFNYLGVIYKEKNMIEKAKEMFLKVAHHPTYPTRENGYYNLSLIAFEEEDIEKALKYINHAIKINPTFAMAFNFRGKIYTKKGDYEPARKDFLKAVKITPESAIFNFNLGEFLYKFENNSDEALNYFERASVLAKTEEIKKLSMKYIEEIDENEEDDKKDTEQQEDS